MRLTKVLALIAVVALAVPLANAADMKHKFSFFAGYAMPMGDGSFDDVDEDLGPYTVTLEADDGMGFGFGYEYRHSDLMSFAASLSTWSHDVNFETCWEDPLLESESGKLGDTSWMPILFDANFHVLRDMKVDFYVGPTLGYAMWDDLNIDATEDIEGLSVPVKDQFVYGLNLGLDVPFGENWAFSGGLRYLLMSAETDEEESVEVDINPIILTVGVGYKF